MTTPDSVPSARSNRSSEMSHASGLSLPEATDFQSLQQYTEAKLAIAAQLRTFLDLLHHRGKETRIQQCEQLTAKLAEDRFTIAVLGQFKRGKSSLLNAIIGRDLLPTGILPLTSVITVLRYGASERLIIYRKTLQFPDCDSIDTLDTYVTEKYNPENRKGIQMVVIEMPLPFLRRGLEFVDTPGIGSAIAANTATTYSFLPNCDAVLFVTSVESPFSEAEVVLLRSIRPIAAKIFFILNKMDLLADADDVAQVTDFVKSRLSREMDVPEVNLIALSARRALQATSGNVPDQLAGSGLISLQETLAHFLASERQTIFLIAVIDRADRLVAAELQETELDEKANEASAKDLKRCLTEVQAKFSLSQNERLQILVCMRERCSQYLNTSAAEELDDALSREIDTAVCELEGLLKRGVFLPAASLIKGFNDQIGRLLSIRTSNWAVSNRQRLIDGLNGVTKDDFTELRQQLSRLATLPHKALGLAKTLTTDCEEEIELPRLEPHFEFEIVGNTRWELDIPFVLRLLPVFLVQPWLRPYLRARLGKLAERHRAVTIEIIQRTVNESILALGRKASVHAANLDRRATALLSKSLKKPGTGEEGRENDEALLYRRGLQTLDANLTELRKRLVVEGRLDEPLESVQPLSTPKFRPDLKPSVKVNDRKAYATRGCAACDYLVGMSKEFFAAFQYSLYNDERQQRSFAENGGFCPFHLWHLESISSPVGFSVGVAGLVKRIARTLEAPLLTTDAAGTMQQIRPPTKKCPACTFLRETEHEFISKFAPSLSEPDKRQLYARSPGLCLHHLDLAIAASPDEETTTLLLRTASTGFRLIAEDMEGFALKRTASRRYMVTGDEEQAHLRAVIHLAGAKHNCMPWTFNDEV
jgi:GTP-binding protein EngB required for normal cell division